MLIIFVALLAGPLVVARLKITLPDIPMQLLQPTGLNNNDTSMSQTGRVLRGGSGTAGGTGAASSTAAAATLKMRF